MDTTKSFECCQSFMEKCFNPGTEEKKGEKFNFENCGQMMKQFFPSKDGKLDFESMRSTVEQCCKGMNKS
jgi:hypothetical protein